jgi:hypothetical protein
MVSGDFHLNPMATSDGKLLGMDCICGGKPR